MSDQLTPPFLNYITDESFRRSLVSDHREMTAAVESQSWKAVHVLAGSLVEAILVDYLYGRAVDQKQKEAVLKYDLGDAIRESKTAGVLNGDTEPLCVVVKKYRNLIHPGRVKRLDQEVTRERGMVAVNLVTIVAEAVAKVQKDTYGYTGEQILNKITIDPDAFPAVLPSLLAKVGDHERERLVFKLLPEENFLLRQWVNPMPFDPDAPSMVARKQCVRLCYTYLIQKAGDDVKRRVVKHYLAVLHDGTELDRRFYEAGLLNEHIGPVVDEADQVVIKDHLFEMLKRGASQEVLENTKWLGQWVEVKDFRRLTDAFLAPHGVSKSNVEAWVSDFYDYMGYELNKAFGHHLQRVADLNEEYGGSPEYAVRIRELAAVPYVPF